jgi:hypothetical protein
MPGETQDFLGMSDEDFLKINPPESSSEQRETSASTVDNPVNNENNDEDGNQQKPVEGTSHESGVADPAPAGSEQQTEQPTETQETDETDASKGEDEGEGTKTPDLAGSKKTDPPASDTVEKKPAEGEQNPEQTTEQTQEAPNYQAFYDSIIGKPIKANGKEIVLKTPDEVIRMVQMGAGFGRKLQDIQPHLKTLRMLEKANLLDENELSYLIDIRNKNPDAIKKLIKDSGIDPLDLNVEDNVTYTPQNHSVSDKEMAFTETLQELQAQPKGVETLQVINRTWDDESKQVLWDQPQIMSIIQTQRDTGVYDQIVAEVDRQRTIGLIPLNTPFLQAYKLAGDTLFPPQPGPQAPTTTTTPPAAQAQSEPKVIATRPAAPKAQVQNSDKASAASPTKTTPRKAATFVNPLEMADDEFLKKFEGRL